MEFGHDKKSGFFHWQSIKQNFRESSSVDMAKYPYMLHHLIKPQKKT